MKLEGERRFEVARQKLWDALLDPQVLARTMPGCEALERTGENSFKGALNIAIGPVKGKFQGTLELSDLDPPRGYRLAVKGQGPAGFMQGDGAITLAEADGGTLLSYALDAQVGGRMAAVGQRLMDSSAKVIAQQGLDGLAAQIEASPATTGAPASAPRPQAPSQMAMATRFAGGLWREVVPPPVRRLLAILAWLALGAALGWYLRGLS